MYVLLNLSEIYAYLLHVGKSIGIRNNVTLSENSQAVSSNLTPVSNLTFCNIISEGFQLKQKIMCF